MDDNMLNQIYGEALIEKLGFRVAVASDGADAVHRWETESFDLILMDCHMPVMDGFAAAGSYRKVLGSVDGPYWYEAVAVAVTSNPRVLRNFPELCQWDLILWAWHGVSFGRSRFRRLTNP